MTASYKFGAASNFIVNITELQNTITNASGVSPITTLSNAVAKLQEMIIYDEKRIAVNTISKFDTSPIQVVDSLNLTSNATITLGGQGITTGGSTVYGQLAFVGNVSSLTNYYNTLSTADTAISFQVGAPATTPIQITAGGALILPNAGTPGIGKYLTCMDAVGTAEWQTPAIPSDARWKTDIEPLANYTDILSGVRGVRYRWSDTGAKDVGVIAQDLMAVFPEAVVEGVDGRPHMVHYHKIIPVLVEAVKELQERVAVLERRVS